jgi:hypothetical protein
MHCLLLLASLGQGVDPQPPAPGAPPAASASSQLDGTWTIVYAAKGGQKMNEKQNESVTIRGNVLILHAEGKEHRMHFNFGPNHNLSIWHDAADQGQQPKTPANETQRNAANRDNNQNARGNQSTPQTPASPGAPALPAQIPGQPGPVAGRNVVNEAMTQTGPQGTRQGVYINAGEFLCLAFDRSNVEGRESATLPPLAPRPSNSPGQPAAQATPVPGQGANAQANNAQRPQPGATAQRPNETPGRTANYPPEGLTPAFKFQPNEFVLILRRQGSQPNSNQGR